MTPLYLELNRWMALPFEWGVSDCILCPADWVASQVGVDPAEDVRMTYHDPGSCQRATRFFTEPLGITSSCLEGRAGLKPTDSPVVGDVSVVEIRMEGRVQPVGAICLGQHGWALKSEGRGVVVIERPLTVLKSWGVGYEA